ncbi:phosphatidylinositol-specific phospholipase C domain-containing protein [Streptomyces sp. NPDC058644]|uniref:phosphatidylinositol-specific phospholipase C domain-containing protein n=1 Tax=unclassified Streptomyces TaxID=2593676 RepID=UPI003650678E
MPGPTPRAARAGSRIRSRPLAHLMTVCVALGAALVTPTAAGAAGSTNDEAYHNLGAPDRNEWMWGVASNTMLSDVPIPGTHDTLSVHGGNYVETQENYDDSGQTLKAQFDRGIRAIDIRVRSIGGKFTVHHASYYQKANFDEVLKKTRGFLKANPHETIVMRLRAECLYKDEKGSPADCKNEPDNVTQEQIRSTFDTLREGVPRPLPCRFGEGGRQGGHSQAGGRPRQAGPGQLRQCGSRRIGHQGSQLQHGRHLERGGAQREVGLRQKERQRGDVQPFVP